MASSGSDLDSAFRDQLQHSLGADYLLERELGGGGMSRVFLARDRRLERDVAVKVLNPEIAVQLSAERFTREIRLAAALQEPHIVPVLSASETRSGLPYYTMPFVRGESLRLRLDRGGRIPIREVVALLQDIAKALAYAHAAGVVHRDIKPENVLLSSGTAVVTDFGIAKALHVSANSGTGAITTPGVAIGTPGYMAPEQAAADPDIDHRVDLYAWGILAYEALSGAHPFVHHDTPRALLVAQLSEIPAPLAVLHPDVPESVAEIVMRCLEKDPERRPRAAGELLAALEATSAWRATPARRRLTERTFHLSEPVLRRLDRSMIDPRLIGASLQYVANDAPAGVLLFCLHGLGHDASDFTPLLESTAHCAIAPTLFGFERLTSDERVPLSVEAHLGLLRELLRDVVERVRPSQVMLVGFSTGADLALRMLAGWRDDLPQVDACLAIGTNLSIATCFVSRVFARFSGDDAQSILSDLQRLGADAADLDEWLNAMTYHLDSLRKFRGEVAPLSRLASDIVRPFERGDDAFADMFRSASERVRLLRCVFERSALCTSLVNALRLRHFDTGILGAGYREDSLFLEPTVDHFALIEPERLERHVGALIADLQSADPSTRFARSG